MEYLKKAVNFTLIVSVVTVPSYFSLIGNTATAGISIISISFGLVFWNLDKFSKFKGAGFEAELKDVVIEANNAIDEVKSLAVSLSEPIVSLLEVKSAFSYLPLNVKLEYVERIRNTLADLKIDEIEINDVVSSIYSRVEKEHISKILWEINEHLSEDSKLFQSFDEIEPDAWSVGSIKRKSIEVGVDVSSNIEALEYFKKYRKLKIPGQWQG